MFWVINKNKLLSIVALSVIVITGVITLSNNAILTNSVTKREIPIYCVDTKENRISLTINCAWNDDDIDEILETLDKYNVKVTFFVVGDWVDKYPDSLKKMYDKGHEIANHSNTHPHVNNLSLDDNIKQINECNKKIEKITGEGTKLYRGPYGEYNNTVISAAKKCNHVVIQWDVDSLDWKNEGKQKIIDRIVDKIKNGSIVLLHNGTNYTALALSELIENIQKKGYNIVKVSDLIYTEDYIIDNTGKQIKKDE